jgi:hypothetical protein
MLVKEKWQILFWVIKIEIFDKNGTHPQANERDECIW